MTTPTPFGSPSLASARVWFRASHTVLIVPALDLRRLECVAVDLTGARFAVTSQRGDSDEYYWRTTNGYSDRKLTGWARLSEADDGSTGTTAINHPLAARLRPSLAEGWVMARVEAPDPNANANHQDRLIGLHRHELLRVQLRPANRIRRLQPRAPEDPR